MFDGNVKELVRYYFEAMGIAGKLDGYSRDDIMEWTLDVTCQLFTGELTSEALGLEVAALDVDI